MKCFARRYMVGSFRRTKPTLDRSLLLRTCLSLLFAALLASCQQTPSCRIAQDAAPLPPIVVPDTDDLLDRAEAAFSADRLLRPPDDAYSLYLAVLDIDPDNPDALRGIERITELFIERARNAIRQERWTVAHILLDQAAMADEQHPSLPSVNTQLRQLRDAERLQLDLSGADVRGKRQSAGNALAAFGVHARKPNARVIIRAGSDIDGRWIYARLNDTPGGRRIRAEVEIGYPPRVVIFLLPENEP